MRLRAEMKLPGKAWLEFEVRPQAGDPRPLFSQTAVFTPKGIAGLAYWNLWHEARTGFLIVDAGMRELSATGRMITGGCMGRVILCGSSSMAISRVTTADGSGAKAPAQMPRRTFASRIPGCRRSVLIPNTSGAGCPSYATCQRQNFVRPPPAGASIAKDYPRPIVDHVAARETALPMFGTAKTRTKK